MARARAEARTAQVAARWLTPGRVRLDVRAGGSRFPGADLLVATIAGTVLAEGRIPPLPPHAGWREELAFPADLAALLVEVRVGRHTYRRVLISGQGWGEASFPATYPYHEAGS